MSLKLVEAAREAVMSGRDPHRVVKDALALGASESGIARSAGPGEVPVIEGTGKPKAARGGSVLPIVTPSRQIPATDTLWGTLLETGDVLPPPYDPWALMATVEESDALPAAVDAMAVNVAGHGWQLEPLFPLVDEETNEPLPPPPEALKEKAEVEQLIAGINPTLGLCGVVDRGHRDLEKVGWAVVEVLRDATGAIRSLEHLPAYTVRLGRLSRPILCDVAVRDPATSQILRLRRYRRFRSFVQVVSGAATWFKEVGDPRFLNWKNGNVRDTSWGMDEKGNALDATELVYIPLYSGYSDYGVPRWVGAAPHVRAGRSASELIAAYFERAPIGCKIALLAGGTFRQDSYTRALSKIDEMARGSENAFTLVTLEADAGSGAARDPLDETRDAPARLTLEDLAWELPETLYVGDQSLIEASSKRVRRTFRLPPLYFGDSDDYSRATAETSTLVAESQVFRPARALWERWFDQMLQELGYTYWQLRLRGPRLAAVDGADLAPLVAGGGATPNQLAARAAELLGTRPKLVPEAWGDRPLELVLALVGKGLDPNKPLGVLAEELRQREEAAAKEAAARLNEVGKAAQAGRSPQRDQVAKSLADRAAEAVEEVAGLDELRERLVALARGE